MAWTLFLAFIMMAGLFLLLFAGVAFIQDKKLFTSAPKDVWEAIQPHPERFRGAHALGWTLGVAALMMMVGAVVYGGANGVQNHFGYWQFFGRFAVMFLLLEAFDVLFFDLFLLTHSHFYQHYYPETEGCRGFHQFGYNWMDHVKTTVMAIVAAFALAAICLLF